MEHVAHLQRMANESWRGSPEHAALTAAIASLSAPQPPAQLASIPRSSPNGWLQAGGLLYRLTEGHRPQNRDEINVTMVHGSRDPAHCEARAAEILAMLQSQQQQPPAEAQPVAWMNPEGGTVDHATKKQFKDADGDNFLTPLYAHPSPSAPVGVERILAEMREEGQADIVDGGVVLEWEDDLRNALSQQRAVPESFVDKVKAAHRATHPVARDTLLSEAVAMIAAAVNLLRTHGPALLSALEDARRYRALRACDAEEKDGVMLRVIDFNHDELLAEADLDAAIDAAIAEGDR